MADLPDPQKRDAGKLREFSAKLAERLRTAPDNADQPSRLAVRVGRQSYLVDLALASEIVPLKDLAPVPWTRPWFRGLVNVRGRLVGVVDFDQFCGRGELPASESQQALVFGEALGVNAALIVTRAFGLRALGRLQPIDPQPDRPAWEHGRWLDADGTVLTELDLTELVKSPAFAMIGV